MSSEKKKTSSVIARDEKERSNFTIFIGEQRYVRYFLRFLSLGNTHSYNRDTTFFVSFLFRLYRGKFLGSKYSEISSETVDTGFVRSLSFVAFRHGVSWSRERWRSPFPTENAKKTVGRNPARERWVTSERFMGFYTLLGRTISSSRFIDSFASFLRHFSFQLIAPSAINFIKLNR